MLVLFQMVVGKILLNDVLYEHLLLGKIYNFETLQSSFTNVNFNQDYLEKFRFQN
jgi:hypothetical protein